MCAISFQATKYALTVGVLQHLFHQKYGYFTCSLLERTTSPVVWLLCKGKGAGGNLLCQGFLLQIYLREKSFTSYSFW